mmetsp:Transcript_15128/g.28466  ORF Transcript_15128/g.28466 Transcript_15128/m.28466 type:complete len:180 (-) Transcript_15128:1980-2519(-)|eukprot:CAMPEP_0176479750 /NCGR_PEP_ID=MMETSP0200_2-20121128/1909_1 /TAXON_ID=947934 /ORGANISM="Chaetoceros sp., Strain GSL56" /LENGTH=179 /DNA_ID=CAMNT_0017875821 /DNA_START=503 /DNA_END=1042 /DNA_ORIENTATION=+
MTDQDATHSLNSDTPQAEPSQNEYNLKFQMEGSNMESNPNFTSELDASNALGQEDHLQPQVNNTMDNNNEDQLAYDAVGQDRAESEHRQEGSYAPSVDSNDVIGSAHFRPIFLGNLDVRVTAEEISDIFTRPALDVPPMPVERVDLKRGFAFVFLKDAKNQDDKERVQRYIDGIQGLYV